MLIIVGLGNPGKKFQKTRHNVGFVIVNEFSKKNEFPNWKKSKKINCFYTKKSIFNKEIELVKPLTYMNNSGEAIKYIVKKHNLKPEDIIVVHDDLDLPLEKIKIIKNRSSAGHKGVQSIIDKLGTKNFVRLRVGIKAVTENNKQGIKDFVLQKFNQKEETVLKGVIKRACQVVEAILKEGVEKAMNKFNC